jgi:hypothetical protein
MRRQLSPAADMALVLARQPCANSDREQTQQIVKAVTMMPLTGRARECCNGLINVACIANANRAYFYANGRGHSLDCAELSRP